MTAFVVVLEHRGITQVAREPMDALRRLAHAMDVRPDEGESLWHAVRRMLRRHEESALISLHALDAPMGRGTSFLDIDVANDPDPIERLMGESSELDLREGLARDFERWQELGIDPINRCRFLLREFDIAHAAQLAHLVETIARVDTLAGLIDAFITTSASGKGKGRIAQGSQQRKKQVPLSGWRMRNAFLEPKTASSPPGTGPARSTDQ